METESTVRDGGGPTRVVFSVVAALSFGHRSRSVEARKLSETTRRKIQLRHERNFAVKLSNWNETKKGRDILCHKSECSISEPYGKDIRSCSMFCMTIIRFLFSFRYVWCLFENCALKITCTNYKMRTLWYVFMTRNRDMKILFNKGITDRLQTHQQRALKRVFRVHEKTSPRKHRITIH